MQFEELKLKDKTLQAIKNVNFKKPTHIQELVLPLSLSNQSLACKGKTGSGKTHCFLITLANNIDEKDSSLQTIILAPTRELAIQLKENCDVFFKNYNIKITLLTGGNDVNKDIAKLNNNPQILIGTPKRIKEVVIDNGLLNINTVKTLIIDEADMTLELGFLNELDKIASLVNKNTQFLLFSATLPISLRQFIKKYFPKSQIIEDEKGNSNQLIEHILYPTRGRDKKELLLKVLANINPYVCLIFLNKKEEVEEYYKFLINNDIDCLIIHGDLPARERKRNIKMALDGKYKYIVCSDIAARGIDIEGVSYVISINIPKNNLEYYIHRAGRCGRNGLKGQSIAFYDQSDKQYFLRLREMGINFNSKEIKDGNWVSVAGFDDRNTRKGQKTSQLDADIQKAISLNKSKKVKTNHKKKVKLAVDKVKRKHKREVIQNDIKRRTRQRAIEKNKNSHNDD